MVIHDTTNNGTDNDICVRATAATCARCARTDGNGHDFGNAGGDNAT